MRQRRTVLRAALALAFTTPFALPAMAADAARQIVIDAKAPTVARDHAADLS
jgi:xylan 1,4-beta-xylosidase